jgi:hypothetical protein
LLLPFLLIRGLMLELRRREVGGMEILSQREILPVPTVRDAQSFPEGIIIGKGAPAPTLSRVIAPTTRFGKRHCSYKEIQNRSLQRDVYVLRSTHWHVVRCSTMRGSRTSVPIQTVFSATESCAITGPTLLREWPDDPS